jgi:prepilin-type N-terminal cleavage/methylation domain-containing protein
LISYIRTKNGLPDKLFYLEVPMKTQQHTKVQRGFSLIEMLIVVAIVLVIAAIAVPNLMRTVYTVRLRSTAGELAGLMQQARITATKSNQVYDIKYSTTNGVSNAYLDLNLNGSLDAGEPVVFFNSGVTPAAGAPTGTGGQPSPYVLTGDTSPNPAYDNTSTLAFNARGLPCDYSAAPTCLTPAQSYFVYYLSSTRGWAAVVVTKAGRTKVVTWTGTQWSN